MHVWLKTQKHFHRLFTVKREKYFHLFKNHLLTELFSISSKIIWLCRLTFFTKIFSTLLTMNLNLLSNLFLQLNINSSYNCLMYTPGSRARAAGWRNWKLDEWGDGYRTAIEETRKRMKGRRLPNCYWRNWNDGRWRKRMSWFRVSFSFGLRNFLVFYWTGLGT